MQKPEQEKSAEERVVELEKMLAETKQQLFLAAAEMAAIGTDDPRRALLDHVKAIVAVINGENFEHLPAAQQSEAVRAVAALKKNYDELWDSYTVEQDMQAREVSVRPTMKDVERLLLCLETPYTVGRIVELLLQPAADRERKRQNYMRAREYLQQLLQSTQ